MDWNDWMTLAGFVRSLDEGVYNGRYRFTDADIVLTWLWAVEHRRPVVWACRRSAWPVFVRRVPRPSPSRMTRRLADGDGAAALLEVVLEHLFALAALTAWLVVIADGKAITVSAHSRDKQATFGAYRLRGYKLHALCNPQGFLLARRVTPLRDHEGEIARRMLRDLGPQGYTLGDTNYEARRLYDCCAASGAQLVSPRKRSAVGGGTRRGRVSAARRRSIDMLETDHSGFGRALIGERRAVERCFGRLETNHGLTRPPAWIRGLSRVRRWVDAILILDLAAAHRRGRLGAG